MDLKATDLSTLSPGHNGIISEVRAHGTERVRFIDLGFAPTMKVKALFKSPSGNQTAYEVLGAVFALRKEDAQKIIINR